VRLGQLVELLLDAFDQLAPHVVCGCIQLPANSIVFVVEAAPTLIQVTVIAFLKTAKMME
jgi:hypothetical protein